MFIIVGADGKEYGPVKPRIILEWLAEGRVNLETKARRDAESAWKTLGDFPEFAALTSRPPLLAETVAAEPPTPALPADQVIPGRAAAEPTLPLAPREMRFAAAFIDGLLKVACFLPTAIPMYAFIQQRTQEKGLISLQEAMQTSNALLEEHLPKSIPFLLALLGVQLALITLRGQSVGKLLLRLRIVREPGNGPAGFLRGFLVRSVLPTIVQQVPILGNIFWIVDSCFVFRADHRCLHDLAAGTKVVSLPPRRD